MEDLILSTIRLSVPVLFAALGGLYSERAGVANVALEGILLVTAFAAAAVAAAAGSLLLGCLSGLLVGAGVGFIFSWTCIYGRGDQIVVGMGFNLLMAGLIPVFNRAFFDNTSSTPALQLTERIDSGIGLLVLALLIVGATHWILKRTLFGLRITAAGELPESLETQGISYRSIRLVSGAICGMIVGFGGISLSLWQGSGYVRDMSAGRGYIALAALIFGGWKPLPTLGACLLFSAADAVQIQLQGTGLQFLSGASIPTQIIQVLPFLATLVFLAVFPKQTKAPASINRELT